MIRRSLLGLLVGQMIIACGAPDVRVVQADRAKSVANSINLTSNAEIENVAAKLELTSRPGLVGFVLLLNDAGQPILYTSVKGKITSGSKRLSSPDNCFGIVGSCPSDEGTFGASNPYIFFFTESGQFIQWSGDYLYSDQPIRPQIEPLVVSITTAAQ